MRRQVKRRYGPIRVMGLWALSIILLGMFVCPGHAQIREHTKDAVQAEEKEHDAGTAVHLEDMTVMAPQPGV